MERDTINPGNPLKLKCNVCGDIIYGVTKLNVHKYDKHSL